MMFFTGMQNCPQHDECSNSPDNGEVGSCFDAGMDSGRLREMMGLYVTVCAAATCFLAWSLLQGLSAY